MNIQIKRNILGCAVGTISVSCILNYYYKLLIDYFTPYPHKIQKHKIPQPPKKKKKKKRTQKTPQKTVSHTKTHQQTKLTTMITT